MDTTCCTVLPLDGAGAALCPALLWMDMRSAAYAQKVAACGDEALMVRAEGGVIGRARTSMLMRRQGKARL